MSKYYLVASYYNIRTSAYENEIIIESIKAKKLNTLSKIDSFTSCYTTTEVIKFIEQETGKKGFNNLSIMYLKNRNATPIYYRIIENDKRFNICLKSSKQSSNYILGKQKSTIYINRSNELYREELEKLLTIIQSKDYNVFKNIYPYDNDFSFLVKRYLEASYDNAESKEEDLNQILVEFSRYKTFRGWCLFQKKLKKLSNKRKNNSTTSQNEQKEPNKKVLVHSIKENMQEFETRFQEKEGKTYSEYTTEQYNIENEEYLSEEEYMSMHDEYGDNKSLGRRH